MESVFLIGCSPKEQYRIKSFLTGSYALRGNPSVNNSLDILKKSSFDLLIYDTENAIPFPFFLDQIPPSSFGTPVAVLSATREMTEIEKLYELGVVSIVKKPCSKRGLLKGIKEGLARQGRPAEEAPAESEEEPQPEAPVFSIRKTETEVLIGLRKQAVISRIGREGISLLLPASLENGTRIMFRNAEFLQLIGHPGDDPHPMELQVKACTKISDYQFQVDAEFFDQQGQALHGPLRAFVASHSVSRKVPSEVKTIVLAEPDSVTRDIYRSYLEKQGHRVVPAATGYEVLDLLEKDTGDLLICELRLPKLSGQEIIEILKKRDNRVPIVVATGETNPGVVGKLRPMVQAFLAKPVNGDALTGAVAGALEKWSEAEAEAPAEGDGFVEVNLQTNLMVAFRDHIKLLGIGPTGLTFSRIGPIAPGTRIFAKTDAISLDSAEGQSTVPSLELNVAKCSPEPDSPTFIVDAEFVSSPGGAV